MTALTQKREVRNGRRSLLSDSGVNIDDGYRIGPQSLVGPLGLSPFSLPTVERALAEMEGSCAGSTFSLGRRTGSGTWAVSPGTVTITGKPTVTGPRTSSGGGSGGASGIRDSQMDPECRKWDGG
ncbi:hypothetical protein EI94DRAFT_1911888 [Lactarius quietus]|nr:hypothetical protein EI94DRAFT_1911888 [Lactarius quietus]